MDIKTRNTVKDIKILDKSADFSAHMKNALVQSKDSAEQTQQQEYSSSAGYASDHVTGSAQTVSDKAVRHLKNPYKKVSENVRKAQLNFQNAKRYASETKSAVKKPMADSPKAAYRVSKSTAGKTVKTAQKTVKTSQRSVKTAAKATRTTAKTAQAAAKAARASAQATRVAVRASIASIKTAIRVTVAAVKATVAAVKGLTAIIAAGGWIAVVIILIVCMAALIIGSCFGIFFSDEPTGNQNGMTLTSAIAQINSDFTAKITEIEDNNPHDKVDGVTTPQNWKDVLTVYSVRTSSDPNNPTEVSTMDDAKFADLKEVFWDMNSITGSTETLSPDSNSSGQTLKTILHIKVQNKTCSEMAAQYAFTSEQVGQLDELKKPCYDSTWNAVLYGISSNDGQLVAAALSQVGNTGGQPYWSWYGFKSHVEWCGCFVSWCANQCGYIDSGIIPKFAGCTSQGVPWFKERGEWQDNSYIPFPGDIIFFDWEGDGEVDHVGIVEKVENGRIYTIEGNSNDSCRQNSYSIGYYEIYGYGVPVY